MIHKSLLVLVFGTVLLGCRAEVIDWCVDNPGECPDCTIDDECVFGGNSCQEVVYCGHVDAEISVSMEGCSSELAYSWPDDDQCRCNAGVCASAD